MESSPSGDSHEFFVLSGSTRCAAGHPWCSYQGIGGNSTAQAFVFKSVDLLHWELLSNWDFLPKQQAWPTGFPHTGETQWPSQRIDTPDTFPLTNQDDGSEVQAFVWLNGPGCGTHWMVGAMDNETKAYSPSTKIGCADRGKDYMCQQSLTTPEGDRVSIAWIGASGAGWDGAQSLPRVITLDSHGLAYKPLPALATLHDDYHFWRHHAMPAGTSQPLEEISKFGGHMHLVLAPKMPTNGTITLSVLGGACEISLAWLCNGKACADAEKCSGSIINNSDTSGGGGKLAASVPANVSIGPEWCQDICCKDPTCAVWTFADPQPGSNVTSQAVLPLLVTCG